MAIGLIRKLNILSSSLLLAYSHYYAWTVPDRAVEPLLCEKWRTAAAALLSDEAQQSDPVTRLLIGYAALASNHTKEAMAMFASVQDIIYPW